MQIEIRELTAEEGREHVPALAGVLLDCVEGGASVSFMAGFTKGEAEAFFENVVDGVARGKRMSRRCWWRGRLEGRAWGRG